MKSPNRNSKLEKAQILPIVVIGVIVIIALAALIIDGGSLMLNRRTAQAAADAGAMAGARELCYPTGADPLVVAKNYALVQNEATNATAELVDGGVKVVASVQNDSFFAKIFNENFLKADAEALAKCIPPKGNYVMPIAWSCRPPVGVGPFDPELGCKMQALSWPDLLEPLVENEVSTIEIPHNSGLYQMSGDDIVNVETGIPPKQIYIVMDKLAAGVETLCKEDLSIDDPLYLTAIKCDLDGDGKNDIEGAGNRGWLDLNNGGGGASAMRDWVKNGLNFVIDQHTWLAGQTGTVTPVYEDIKEYRQGTIVLIPVFNSICDDTDPIANTVCMDDAHEDPPWPPLPATGDIDENGGQKPKFHVIAFDPFYISCVHTKQGDHCPGFKYAQDQNMSTTPPYKSLIPDNTPAIEGYFLKDIVDIELEVEVRCNINLGNCIVSLIN